MDTTETINGIDALHRAELVSKGGGTFALAFFPHSRKKTGAAQRNLKIYSGCTCRLPLPHEKWDIDGKNYFLFLDDKLKPKTCYRVLIRYIGFPDDGYKLKKVIWYDK